MAVVSGVYNLPGWDRLVDAEAEATEIATRYGAVPVNASSQDVRRLVAGEPAADLMHFAVHGQYDPNGEIDGIVLVDGLTLDPMQVRGSPLSAHPFVFLNACQVGSGESVLGDYAGMAEAFLFAGASGVIAPLWSIDDVAAREIALRFYEKALQGRAPADILREERAAFRDDPTTISSTYLAYQYFGHPHMTLARAGA
jgi:CHAT domain-containing protein